MPEAEAIVRVLELHSASVAIVSITKEAVAWERFWNAAKPLHDAIVLQNRSAAGFIKPANAVLFAILGHAFPLAHGHAVRLSSRTGVVDSNSLEVFERTIVCDSDLQGEENIEVFEQIWERSDKHQPRIRSAGMRFVTREVRVITEEEEPMLLLADFAAGIAHSALIERPGRIPLPLGNEQAKLLLNAFNATGKLVVVNKPFDLRYEEMYGEDTMAAAAKMAR